MNFMEKLNNKHGESIVMALFLLLVAVVVSAVIITAAYSAAVNQNTDKKQQQELLTVTSAAELIRNSIYEDTSISKSNEYYWDENYTNPTGVTDTSGTQLFHGDFSVILNKAVNFLQENEDLSFSANFVMQTDKMQEVSVSFKMVKAINTQSGNTDLTATIVFTSAAVENYGCKMQLLLNGEMKTTGPSAAGYDSTAGAYKMTTATEINWTKAEISKGEN